eukprot:CAMPEP_0170243710 /NCGR_PEP_ID=MMETSP0116_2-20130129/21631_1 /TAXON_ID=400756 /ORGANISM="Durinskia baltica, Strain CSIRO CS-38" /LENGTH=246 /DNA_ID=CAMNT_0010494565 /DNA_START=85 /DNA_END=825 /DNA_ORIENTATION=-
MDAPTQQNMAFSILDGVSCIKIKEKVNMIEAASAILGQEIEMANKYKVVDKESGQQLFYAVEQTDCCMRQMKQCFGDCAPWKLDILAGGDSMAPAVRMERAFTCTCCCFNRPVVQILEATSGATMASIIDPWTCCDYTFTVRDASGADIVMANGGCCQWGLCCPLPCGPCSKVTFDLRDADGSSIGELKKKVPGILKYFLAPDVDNYTVEFAKQENWSSEKKMMMIALSIFMDFRLFNDNKNDDKD